MERTLSGKVALVTGAGRGIGRDLAREFGRRGAKVVVNDLGSSSDGQGNDETPAQHVVNEILHDDGEAIANFDDVSSMTGAQHMVDAAISTWGHIDIVVNNAGIVRDRMIFNMSEEEWDRVIAVHLKGTFATTRAAAPHFRSQKSGRFINFTSTSGLIGNYGQANYAAAKLGIVGLTRSTAIEMAKYGVTANAVSPFAWSRLVGTIPDDPHQQDRLEKLKKMDPAQIAPLVAFLAGDGGAAISGQVFAVRGHEIVLFALPRPIRWLHRDGGWTVEALQEVLPDTWKNEFTPLHVTTDVFPYDPLV